MLLDRTTRNDREAWENALGAAALRENPVTGIRYPARACFTDRPAVTPTTTLLPAQHVPSVCAQPRW
jgi:hypothetical protein